MACRVRWKKPVRRIALPWSKADVKASSDKIRAGIMEWARDGRMEMMANAKIDMTPFGKLGMWISAWNKSLGMKLSDAPLLTVRYMGNMMASNPMGFGGSLKRPVDAAILKDLNWKELQSEWLPEYRSAVKEYAEAIGEDWQGWVMAEVNGRKNDALWKLNQNTFRELSGVDTGDVYAKKMVGIVRNLEKRSIEMMQTQGMRTDGMTLKIPLNRAKLLEAVERSGEVGISKLLIKGGVELKDFFTFMDEAKMHDVYGNFGVDITKIKWDVTHEDMNMWNFVDGDIATLMDKMSRSVAARAGLHEATDGVLSSMMDATVLQGMIAAEGRQRGINTVEWEIWADDMVNKLFDRPVRGGVSHEVRNVMNMVTLSRMGSLGTAQMSDTAQAALTTIMHAFDGDFVKAVVKLAGRDAEEDVLAGELHQMNKVWQGLEELTRFDRFVGDAEYEGASKLREMSMKMSDAATMGDLKILAMKGLGKITGSNAIRRWQSRVAMASYVFDVARFFTGGKSKISADRLRDHGLINLKGENENLKRMFEDVVEYDNNGIVDRLNLHKWDYQSRRQLAIALNRMEAEVIQRSLAGEQPAWMNPVAMQVIMQFRDMSFVAGNKQTLRQLAFGDKEAMTALGLNTAFAALTRVARAKTVATVGALVTGKDVWDAIEKESGVNAKKIMRYDLTLGMTEDLMFVADTMYQRNWGGLLDAIPSVEYLESAIKLKDVKDRRELIDEASRLSIYGNTFLVDMMRQYILSKDLGGMHGK